MHIPRPVDGKRARIAPAACFVAAVVGLLCAPVPALAQDAISEPAEKTIGAPAKKEIVPSLIVMNSRGARLEGMTLTLTGVAPNSILFADRPVRAAGHALTADLMREWTPGTGTFDRDPPNATVSVLSSDASGVSDVVLVLKDPKLSGDTLTFNVEILEGDLAGAEGPASIFIDIFGVWRRAAYRAAWYGAATAPYSHPYYHPPCGYYPYPPCY